MAGSLLQISCPPGAHRHATLPKARFPTKKGSSVPMMTVHCRRLTTLLYSLDVSRAMCLWRTDANVFVPASRMRSRYHAVFPTPTRGFHTRCVRDRPHPKAIVAAQATIGALSMSANARLAEVIWLRASASELKSGGHTITTRTCGMWSRSRCSATSAPMECPTIVRGGKSTQARSTRST